MLKCPKCDARLEDVEEDELDEGDPLMCEECGASIIVTGLDPVELETEAEEDDDDEDDDDDFDDEDDEDEYEEDEEDEDEDGDWR